MVLSMTGYGRGTADPDEMQVRVEIKTVNHRFTEYQVRMPRELLYLEDAIKKQIGQYIKRGRVEVFINLEGSVLHQRKIEVDWDLMDDYFAVVSQVREKYNLDSSPALQDILKLEELVSIVEGEDLNPMLEPAVMSAVKEAAANLYEMRKQEGMLLEKDIADHLRKIRAAVELLKERAPLVSESYKNRLLERMASFTEGLIDETRVLTETAVFAEKADINEELSRLFSHMIQFEQNIASSEPVGRKLDFLVQEMNREINTIGSKANDASIAAEVVEVKSLLEKIKEQVQNIE
ncbi:YicC/YloC family endoribonuclease [Peribacillus kribbensis]|uniref:YicC/YloC family endoribonuclease n=1 Tax=Peribacillus kribbensis TaxID=356658 RepID=UPI00047C9FDF|nr:YicC/YloC family endoribonuclease [Peribacillus kribbensis]